MNHPVAFTLEGSSAGKGHRLRTVRVSFGDGAARTYSSLSAVPRHTYRRVGAFRVTATVVSSVGRRASAHQSLVVGGANKVVLKRTTSRMVGSAVVGVKPLSATRQLLTLKPSVSRPVKGHVLLVGRGSLASRGMIAVVQSVSKTANGQWRVTVRDGSLADAYATLAIVSTTSVGKSARVVSGRTAGGTRLYARARAVPFTCTSSGAPPVNVTADLTDTHMSTTIDLAHRTFQFSLISRPVLTLGVQFSGTASCHLAQGIGLDFPVPSAPGLVVSVEPYFALRATGAISANASWHPVLVFAVTRAPNNDSRAFAYRSSATADATSVSATVTLQAGLSIQVSIGKQAGLAVDAGPELTAAGEASQAQACLTVTSKIGLTVRLFAHALWESTDVVLYNGEFFRSTIFAVCKAGSSGTSGSGTSTPGVNTGTGTTSSTYNGPTVPESTGSVARTWTDYVHAGGSEGPAIGANRTVGVVCKVIGFTVADGNTWWYLVGSSPWNAAYFVSADPFYNNGQTSGDLHGTPFVDPAVPDCAGSVGAAPAPVTPPVNSPSPTPQGTYTETVGGVTHTWTDHSSAAGTEGPSIPSNASVQVACRDNGFRVADGNTWWYQIASSPWSSTFWASADAFYNNGQTSGSLHGTPFYDPAVPVCQGAPPPPETTYGETVGGVTHTWTDYSNAGGTQGPSIPAYASVQVACKVTGFRVADGNTWWYRIASSPWSDAYYASADAFYNNGQTSGPLAGTPWVDPNVRDC